jgi:TRAP-type C4-dicarboxylate transport system permease small subunit
MHTDNAWSPLAAVNTSAPRHRFGALAVATAARQFYRLLAALACVAMVAAFAAIVLGVVARLTALDIPGLDAYAGYAIAAALFLALPQTFRRGEHIRVTLLLQRLSGRARTLFELWGLAAGLVLAGYVAWFACRLVWLSYITHDVSQGPDATPLWMPQIAMALGSVGFALSFADALLARLQGRTFFEGSDGEAAHIE